MKRPKQVISCTNKKSEWEKKSCVGSCGQSEVCAKEKNINKVFYLCLFEKILIVGFLLFLCENWIWTFRWMSFRRKMWNFPTIKNIKCLFLKNQHKNSWNFFISYFLTDICKKNFAKNYKVKITKKSSEKITK